VIDERYERIRARRKQLERRVIRGMVLALVVLGAVTIIASLQTGSELYAGTLFVEKEYAGDPIIALAVMIAVVLLPICWIFPRPRTVVAWGVALWLMALAVVIMAMSSYHRHDTHYPIYRTVRFAGAQELARSLTELTLFVVWVLVPVVAAIYGLVCVIADERKRRELPPAPEFPTARIH
jgi:hypothetical protein